MQDVVARTPRLSFIDLQGSVVFGRFGRSDAEGAFATCHCLTLPESEPGYYFWRDRDDGRTDAPVRVVRHQVARGARRRHADQVPDLVRAAALLRSVARAIAQGRALSADAPAWIAKLDTIVHELYHIDPERRRHAPRRAARTARDSPRSHGPQFYEDVAAMVQRLSGLAAGPGALRFPAATISRRSPRATAASSRRRSGISRRFRSATWKPVDMPAADPLRQGGTAEAADAAACSTPKTICTSASSPKRARRRLTRKGQHRAA